MKKALIALVVVFLGFWLITDPRGLADAAGRGGGQIVDLGGRLFDAIIAFINELS